MTAVVVREPLYRRVPDCRMSFGDLAAAVGAAIGLPPDAEQRAALDAIFAERAPGEPAARHAGIIGARQNIKTSTLEIAAAADLLVLGIPDAVWTAHESKTASKSYADLLPRLLANEDYAPLIDYRGGRGEERIFLLDDPAVSLEYRARSGGSGRGFTTSRITLDEALYLRAGDMGALLPTMLTRRDAQVRYGSSGGFAFSEVLRGLRDRARAGTDPRLFYVEYGAEKRECEAEACTHKWGVSGCALDDRELWWQANCALWSGRIDEENILDLRRSMPPEEFAREVLVWWDDPGLIAQGIPAADWLACGDTAGQIDGNIVFSIDVALDRHYSSLGVVGRRADDRLQGELIAYHPGTSWLVDAAKTAALEWNAPVALDQAGPGASLQPELEAAGVEVIPLPRGEVVQACGFMLDAVKDGTFAHLDDPVLNSAVNGARLRSGESYVFTRKGDVDISPLYAVALALWVCSTRETGPSIYESRGLLVL